MAWVLGKPTVFCEYEGRRRAGLKAIPATGALPVDLHQLVRVRFSNDDDLARKIYFGFSRFLRKNGLGS